MSRSAVDPGAERRRADTVPATLALVSRIAEEVAYDVLGLTVKSPGENEASGIPDSSPSR
jgi:hypothetical protein